MREGHERNLQKAIQVRMGMAPKPSMAERAEELHKSARVFLLRSPTTEVGTCDLEECIHNNREEHTCTLPEITIGLHPQSRKFGCMQFESDFEYVKRRQARR